MWKLCHQKSSKLKVSIQENCSLNQDKSSTLNRPGQEEYENSISYTLPCDNQYKASTLPTRTAKTNKVSAVSIASTNTKIMSASEDSCAINELLEGRMYLTVLLPPELVITNDSKKSQENKIKINVERRTPMMDILVNIATQFKFNASKYRINVDGYNFQASTPIGSLDVNTVSIVPKPVKPGFRSNIGTSEMNLPQSMPSSSVIYSISSKQRSAMLSTPSVTVKSSANNSTNSNSNHSSNHQGLSYISSVPFKPTFRLQVNLPRNQLMVLRVSPESTIAQIKSRICDEKELDSSKYQLTTKNEREILILDSFKCLSDYGINEVSLMPTNLLVKVQMEQSTAHHISGANDNQSVNQNGDESNKVIKKRPAPLPPSKALDATEIGVKSESSECEESNSQNNIHLQQDSGSDSSGYHESMISSESLKSSSDAISQPKSQNKLSDKENIKKGIIKKRKAPLPPNWRDNKREVGESIDCLSDVSVPLSSSSDASRQSDYRLIDGRDSNKRTSPHEDESSFTLTSGSDDLDDVGTLKGSDSVPIPSPDSGTSSHIPLDEEKSSVGITSAFGSAIMSDSAIGETIVEEAEIESEQQKTYNYDTNKRQSMEPLSYSSTSSCRDGVHSNSNKVISKLIGTNQYMEPKTPANMNDHEQSSNSTSSYELLSPIDFPLTEMKPHESLVNMSHNNTRELASEYEQFTELSTNAGQKLNLAKSNCSGLNETPNRELVESSSNEFIIQLDRSDTEKSTNFKSNEICSDGLKEIQEALAFLSSKEMVLIEDTKDDKSLEMGLNSSDVNQKEEEPSVESTRTPTIVSELKTIVNGGETNRYNDDENHHLIEETKVKESNEKKDDCLSGQDVKTRSPRLDQADDDNEKKIDENNDNDNENSISSKFVRDLCRPRVRLTNFKIGSYKEVDNLDIYQNTIGLKTRPKSLNTDGVKPIIITASFKNISSSACNEFGHNNTNSKSSQSSHNRISMITPQPFALNRLASWSGTDTKSFRQAYSNVSNCIEDRETIAEKAEKIEKVLRMDKHLNKLSGFNNNENTTPGFYEATSHAPKIVGSSNLNGHRCVSRIEINGDSAKVSIRNSVTSIKGINTDNDESPIQVTTFVKSEQPELTEYKQHRKIEFHRDQSSKQIQFSENEMNTKLEIINTVKPLSKTVLTKMEQMNSKFNVLPTKSVDARGSVPKVPESILPAIIPQSILPAIIPQSILPAIIPQSIPLSLPPPPPPPPMPKTSKIPSKINSNISIQRSKSSIDQMNGKEKQSIKSVPKFKKRISCINSSSAPKLDYHDALLNEIRACGGRRALRKVNVHR